MKNLYIFILLVTFSMQAQISTLPATESFSAAFTEGTDVQFIPNWTANTVQATARVFRDEVVFASAPAAMGVIPTGSFNADIRASLNLSAYSGVAVTFLAKSMSTGGSRPSRLSMDISIDGGTSWVGNQNINEFPNEDQVDFQTFSYNLPIEANNQASVLVRFRVETGTGGSGTRAKVVIDDVNFAVSSTPTVASSSNALTFTQVLGFPTNSQVINVSGLNLTANVTLSTTSPFEISTIENGPFSTSLNLTQSGGNLASTPVYVRLNNASAGSSSESLTISSTGATSVQVTLNGTTTAPNVTTPSAFSLSGGNYSFNEWSADSVNGTYPANMVFWTHATTDPDLNTLFIADYTCLYNLTSRSRVQGQDENGFSFVNTGNSQFIGVCDGSVPTQTSGDVQAFGRLGAAVLALNTTGVDNVVVNWTGRTIVQNTRVYGLRLQYKIGGGDANAGWMDFETPIEYVSGETDSNQPFITNLPSSCNNQALVQLRWVYYFKGEGTGARAQIGLDDIVVSSTLGTNNFENSLFVIYPNPANSFVNFNKAITGQLLNINGQVLMKFENVNQINIENLQPGIYFVKNNEGATQKLMVK